MDRRSALKLLGAGGLVAATPPQLHLTGARASRSARRALLDSLLRPSPSALKPTLQVFAYRRDDLFDLRFDLYNLVLDTTGPARLVRQVAAKPAYIVVVFPFQNVAEAAVDTTMTSTPPWPDPPLPAVVPGPSQLAFELPESLVSVPFTMAGLLDWTKLFPFLVPVAVPTPKSAPQPPDPLRTFIELPWNLWLSPDAKGRWNHSSAPVTHGRWTELWQTRLGVGKVEPPASTPEIRAFWSPNYPQLGPDDPFSSPYALSLAAGDRRDVVLLSSGGYNADGVPIPSVSIAVKLFMLTGLGASTDFEGSWNSQYSSLTDWKHRMTTGRESYVRIVRSGYIYPWRHKAVLIKITDREFQVSPGGDVVAYLVQKKYVQITQPTMTYEGTSPEPYSGRENPFREVRIKTVMTPPLDETGFGTLIVPDVGGVEQALWIRSAGHDVPFAMSATDFEGKKVDLTTSLIWVNSDDAADYTAGGTIQSVEAAYSSAGNVTRRTADLKGGLVAFAPSDGGKPGSTSHHADALEFDGAVPDPSGPFPTFTPAWHPVVHYLTLRVPAAEQVVGGELPGMPPVFKYAQPYLDNGFQAGKPPVFLVLKSGSNSPGLKFPANNSGGMATPNFSIDGLSRDQGPVADALNLLGGTFDPKTFFQGLGAKVLGAIDLADIIAQALGSDIATKAPKIQSMPVYPNDDKSKPPTALDTTVDWTPDVRKDPLGFFEPKAAKDKTLSIHVKIHTPVADPSKTATTIEGQLVDFNLNLFGLDADGGLTFIIIHFKKVHFSAKTGAKANVDVDIDTVTFAGPLTFINELEQLLASLGGPSIDVQPSGVTASYSLPLPSIGVGVFAIENISLGGSVTIPFDGTPVRLRVNFCTRENPFLLSISLFAGGGFFGIGLGADGIELIEVSLEFGASVSLDLGVASGGVSIMAGIYFKLSSNPSPPPSDIVQLTGFLQASGNLEVLGIISISIVFYLGFTYLDPGKCYGTASVTVTVKVLFFSASVSMTVTKTFGGGGDPAFAQAISQADWDNYCDAFV